MHFFERGNGMKNRQKLRPWIYSLPALTLVGLIVVFPILYTGYISLTNMNLYHWDNYELIGLDNFGRALLKVDSGFLKALLTTVLWTLLMFPWAMPAYVSILLWRVGMFNTEFGFLNKVLLSMGLGKMNFLSENVPAFLSCMALNLWMALPFMIMMMDGALQSVDRSYYESARLDGAGFWKQCRYITVPAIRPILLPSVIMTTFTTFKQFDIVYLLTMQKGSLSGATLQTIITYAHQNAFVSNNYGLSSAVSIVIFGFIIVFSLFTNRGVKEEA